MLATSLFTYLNDSFLFLDRHHSPITTVYTIAQRSSFRNDNDSDIPSGGDTLSLVNEDPDVCVC